MGAVGLHHKIETHFKYSYALLYGQKNNGHWCLTGSGAVSNINRPLGYFWALKIENFLGLIAHELCKEHENSSTELTKQDP